MKLIVSKALAAPALLVFSLCQAVPAQAANATLAVFTTAAGQVYITPGIARFFKGLMALLG